MASPTIQEGCREPLFWKSHPEEDHEDPAALPSSL